MQAIRRGERGGSPKPPSASLNSYIAAALPPQFTSLCDESIERARRKEMEQTPQQQLRRPNDGPPKRCPRCDSTNTKFCYFNNYSASQPRHFCKACRRYWTEGGTLRNIPQGGGGGHRRRRPKRSCPAAASTAAAATAALINLPDRSLDDNQGPAAAAVAVGGPTLPQVPPSLYLAAGGLGAGRRIGGGMEGCTAALQALNSETISLGGFQHPPESVPSPLNHPLLSAFNYRIPQQLQQQQLGFQLALGDGALHQLLPVNANLMLQPRVASSVSQQGWQLSSTPQQQQQQQPNTACFTTSTTPPATTAGGGLSSDVGESLWTDILTGAGGSARWAAELSGPGPRPHSSQSFI